MFLSSRSVIQAVRTRIPPLSDAAVSLYKGQSGRILVVGGSVEYVGAPFFAAMTSLRCGSDICHIISHPEASAALKVMSPELIVHPLLDPSHSSHSLESHVTEIIKRVHVVVVGPGLSRDPKMLEMAKRIIIHAKELNLSLIIDADGLFLIQQDPDLIRGYSKAILTPNHVELLRLLEKMGISQDSDRQQQVIQLSKSLDGVLIVSKGASDVITNGDSCISVGEKGSPRRCGGQGDLLSGAIATFIAWTEAYEKNIFTRPLAKIEKEADIEFADGSVNTIDSRYLACASACILLRRTAKRAFDENGRAMSATKMLDCVGQIFAETFDEAESKKRN